MFDLEGLPPQLDELDRIFLWGIKIFGEGAPRYERVVAMPGCNSDREAWFEFLGLVHTVFDEFGLIPFIHWAAYERTKVRQYISRYGDPESVAAKLLELLVDLESIARKSVYLPLPSYSLKVVEKYVRFERRLQEWNGERAMAQYIEACEENDPERASRLIAEGVAYNEEDLDATWAVYQWFKSKAQASAIA